MPASGMGGKNQDSRLHCLQFRLLIRYEHRASVGFRRAMLWLKRLDHLDFDNTGAPGRPALAYPAHQHSKEEQCHQQGQREAGYGAKDSRRFFPASGKEKTQAKRNNNAQYLTANIPEQKVGIRVEFQSRHNINRATEYHDEKARDKDRPTSPAPEVRAPSLHSLRRNETETLLFLKPADESHSHAPANKIAQVVTQHGGA